jgi:glucose-1-phosphate cytidylyltransferase
MVLEPEIFDIIEGDETTLEQDPLEHLADANKLAAFLYHGFWQCMDTLRDKEYLEKLWAEGNAPLEIMVMENY